MIHFFPYGFCFYLFGSDKVSNNLNQLASGNLLRIEEKK